MVVVGLDRETRARGAGPPGPDDRAPDEAGERRRPGRSRPAARGGGDRRGAGRTASMSAEAVGEVPGAAVGLGVAPSAAARLPAPRLAITAFATARFDLRSWRMARSASRVPDTTSWCYGRWEPGLARDEVGTASGSCGCRCRAPAGVRPPRAASPCGPAAAAVAPTGRRPAHRDRASPRQPAAARTGPAAPRRRDRARRRPPGGTGRPSASWLRFPHAIMPWAAALERRGEPAEIWHGRLSAAWSPPSARRSGRVVSRSTTAATSTSSRGSSHWRPDAPRSWRGRSVAGPGDVAAVLTVTSPTRDSRRDSCACRGRRS